MLCDCDGGLGMPTTFSVFSLGQQAIIDPTEGNTNAENASALVGESFGSSSDPLFNSEATFSSISHSGGGSSYFDQNQWSSSDQFSIDGSGSFTFDAAAIYNATITYSDGTTDTITAVVFQDTNGNTYLAPEFSDNADQAALEAGPIESLSLDSLAGSNYSGLTANREDWDVVTCFAKGTLILTTNGERMIEDLAVGDLVETRDSGAQAIRWIGGTKRKVSPKLAPIRITAGALGQGLPKRDLLVSPQHRMLVRSRIAQRMSRGGEVLVAAKKLLDLPGVLVADEFQEISYYHILCDDHQILFAEGAEAESFYLGAMALQALDEEALEEVKDLLPELLEQDLVPARPIASGAQANRLVARHRKNNQALV